MKRKLKKVQIFRCSFYWFQTKSTLYTHTQSQNEQKGNKLENFKVVSVIYFLEMGRRDCIGKFKLNRFSYSKKSISQCICNELLNDGKTHLFDCYIFSVIDVNSVGNKQTAFLILSIKRHRYLWSAK